MEWGGMEPRGTRGVESTGAGESFFRARRWARKSPAVSAQRGTRQSPPPVLPRAIKGPKGSDTDTDIRGVSIGRENCPSGGHYCARFHNAAPKLRRGVSKLSSSKPRRRLGRKSLSLLLT